MSQSRKSTIALMIFWLVVSSLFAQVPEIDPMQTVNPVTGQMSFQIPLGAVPSLSGSSYPISLNYSAGIQYYQKSGAIGLGFSLNESAITRKEIFLPDDLNSGYSETQESSTEPTSFGFFLMVALFVATSIVTIVSAGLTAPMTVATAAAGTKAIAAVISVSIGLATQGISAGITALFSRPNDFIAGGDHTPKYDYAKDPVQKGFFVGGESYDLPDIYFISTPWISGQFVWRGTVDDGRFEFVPSTNGDVNTIKYDKSSNKFQIHLGDGTILYFDLRTTTSSTSDVFTFAEVNRRENAVQSNRRAFKSGVTTMWHLTKVEFQGKTIDMMTLEYESDGLGNCWQSPTNCVNRLYIENDPDMVTLSTDTTGKVGADYEGYNGWHLKKIVSPLGSAEIRYQRDKLDDVWFNFDGDDPLTSWRCTGVDFYDDQKIKVKHADFLNSFLLRPHMLSAQLNGGIETGDWNGASLTLNSAILYDVTSNNYFKYNFGYSSNFNPLMKSVNLGRSGQEESPYGLQFGHYRDYWGYYNETILNDHDKSYGNKERFVSPNNIPYASAWSLESVSFLGKKIQWDYESNSFDAANGHDLGQEYFGGGIRVKNITETDSHGAKNTYQFRYTESLASNNTSGHATVLPYAYMKKEDTRPKIARGGLHTPAQIMYERVEIKDSRTRACKVLEFRHPGDAPNGGMFGQIDQNWQRGMIKRVDEYLGSELVTSKLFEYKYESENYFRNSTFNDFLWLNVEWIVNGRVNLVSTKTAEKGVTTEQKFEDLRMVGTGTDEVYYEEKALIKNPFNKPIFIQQIVKDLGKSSSRPDLITEMNTLTGKMEISITPDYQFLESGVKAEEPYKLTISFEPSDPRIAVRQFVYSEEVYLCDIKKIGKDLHVAGIMIWDGQYVPYLITLEDFSYDAKSYEDPIITIGAPINTGINDLYNLTMQLSDFNDNGVPEIITKWYKSNKLYFSGDDYVLGGTLQPLREFTTQLNEPQRENTVHVIDYNNSGKYNTLTYYDHGWKYVGSSALNDGQFDLTKAKPVLNLASMPAFTGFLGSAPFDDIIVQLSGRDDYQEEGQFFRYSFWKKDKKYWRAYTGESLGESVSNSDESVISSLVLPAYLYNDNMRDGVNKNLSAKSASLSIAGALPNEFTSSFHGKILSGNLTTWKQHQNQWVPDNSYVYVKTTEGTETTEAILNKSLQGDPLEGLTWVKVGGSTRYNSYNHVTETVTYNGPTYTYRNIIRGHLFNVLPIATIDGARFEESGVYTADYDLGEPDYLDRENGWERGNNNDNLGPIIHSVELAGTPTLFGQKSIKVTNAFGPTRNFRLEEGKNYIFTAWVKNASGQPINPADVIGGDIRPITSFAGVWPITVNSPSKSPGSLARLIKSRSDGWCLIEWEIPASTVLTSADWANRSWAFRGWVGSPQLGKADNATIYVGEIRFFPEDAVVSTTYYDQKLKLPIISLDANSNSRGKTEYDSWGRVAKVWRDNDIVKRFDYHHMSENSGVTELQNLYRMSDSVALVTLMKSTTGWVWPDNPVFEKWWGEAEHLIGSKPWADGTPLDQWYGVSLNNSGRVIGIQINTAIIGYLPPSFYTLSALQYMDFSYTRLNINWSDRVDKLASLQHFVFHSAELTFPKRDFDYEFPKQICQFANLRELNISNNHLAGGTYDYAGDFPEDIGNLTKLEYLDIENTKIGGVIPESITKCDKLGFLSLSGTGVIYEFEDLEKLPNLSFLRLTKSFPPSYTGVGSDTWVQAWAKQNGITVEFK